MSQPEKDNLEINKVDREEQSTIFSNPAHYDEQPREASKKSKHASLIKIIAVVLAALIAVGAYLAVDKLVPEPEEEEKGSILIDVITTDAAHVKEIKIKNQKGEYKISPKITEGVDESTTEWMLDGVNSDYVDSATIEDVAAVVLNVDAIREVDKDADDFGFEDPLVTAEVVGEGEAAKSYTVVIGNDAPADLGCYCKIQGQDKVYIIDSNNMLTLQKEPIEFAITTGYTGVVQNSENASCFVDGALSTFDYISVSGEAHKEVITIKPQTDDAINAYFAYMVTSPVKRIADDEQVSTLLKYFEEGVASVGAYSYSADDAQMKKYRLDKPDYEVTLSLNGQKNTIRFSKIDDLYCALIDGRTDMIHQVPVSSLTICQDDVDDYYSTFIILETLSGLKQMKVNTPDGKEYVFDLKYTAADEENNVKQSYQAFYNGRELDISNFKRYYQKMIALTPISHENKEGLKTDAKITLVHSADTDDVVLTFKKYSSGRYQVELDGIPMGLITATAFNQLMSDTPKVAADQTISE